MSGDLLLKACRIIGSQGKLAKKIGVKLTRLNAWINMSVNIPYEYALAIEQATEGAIRVEELSPQKARIANTHQLRPNHTLYGQIQQVPISSIKYLQECSDGLKNIRRLVGEILEHELLRPIAVDSNYQLIFGGLQLCACKLIRKNSIAGWILNTQNLFEKTPPVDILNANFTIIERAAIGIAFENLNNYSANTKCIYTQKLISEQGEKIEDVIAEKLGFSDQFIYEQAKKIYKCNMYELIRAVEIGRIPISAAIEIIDLPIEQQKLTLNCSKRAVVNTEDNAS